MFTFQVITKEDEVIFFETNNYTDGIIKVGGIDNIKLVRVWDGKNLIKEDYKFDGQTL